MAYHPAIKTRCVTLDGNDYSPSGLLTSGHRSARGALLQPIHELNLAKSEARKAKAEFKSVNAEMAAQREMLHKHLK